MVASPSSSQPSDKGKSIAKAYIREMLELNPIWESAAILRRRRELWTGETASPASRSATTAFASSAVAATTSSDGVADRRLEERARRCLDKLQESFFQLPEKKLNEYIAFLHNDRLPEFAAKAARLKTVAEHRNTLLQVPQETGDEKFSYSLLHALVCPAANAGSLKEQYIESIIAERRVKSSCKMIRQFVDKHPEIYAMERDWFDLFLDKANQKQWTAQYSLRGRYKSFAGSRQWNLVALAVFIAVAVIVPLVKTGDSSRRRPSRSSTSSPYSTQKHDEMMNKLRRNSLPGSQSRPQFAPPSPSASNPGSVATGDGPDTGFPTSPTTTPTFEELIKQSRKQRDESLRSVYERIEQLQVRPQGQRPPGETTLPSFEPPSFEGPTFDRPRFEPPRFEPPGFQNVPQPTSPQFNPF